MVKRKYLLLCLILILLSIAGVSASDADNITVQTSTDMPDEDIVSDIDEISVQEDNGKLDDAIASNQEENQNKLAVSEDENMIVGLAFKDLQKLVDDTPEGGELSLDNNYYVASGGHAIHISKSITINGNNYHLDAGGDGRIAIIEADGRSVVFKNIIFENGKVSDSGGAIYNEHSSTSLTIINCSFNNNKADVDGGAIYNKGETKIYDSNFTNNAATGGYVSRSFGGAIRSEGLITIENSRFENNHARERGGAIYADTVNHVFNSIFIKNTVDYYFLYELDTSHGGAFYIDKECSPEFISCRFERNSGFNGRGGAIYLDSSDSYLKVSNCTFKKNKDHRGGAIFTNGDISIKDSSFTDNTAGNGGGAIFTNGDISMKDSSFTDNTAEDGGGAVYAATIGIVSNSTFIRNKVIHVNHDVPTANTPEDTPILKYDVSVGKDDGGAIYINKECSPEFISCRFEGNTADNRGGAIYLDSTNAQLKISYCTFVDNNAEGPGHNVYNSGHYNLMDVCWYGTNNPDFKDQFKKYYFGKSDTDYNPQNYLKIGIKINETENIHVGDKYEVTVYFHDVNGNVLGNDLLHSTGRFSGDAEFTNLKVDYNDMTADAMLTKENPEIIGELDHERVTLKLTTNNTSDTASDNAIHENETPAKDNNTKQENKTTTPEKTIKTTDNTTTDKKAIKTTNKETLKPTGNPIFALLLMLMTIGITTIRRFK